MTPTRKSTKVSEDEDQLFRLTNIRPNENSVVDRPANLRDWVIVKSEDGMKVVENPDGSITVKKEEEMPPEGGPPAPAAEEPAGAEEKPEEAAAEEGDGLGDALRQMGEKMLEMAEGLKGADSLDEEQMQALQLLAEELMGMLKRTDEPTTKNAKDLVTSFHADLVAKAGSMKALHLAEAAASEFLGLAKSEKANKAGHPAVATVLKMRALSRVLDTIINKAKGEDEMSDDATKKTDDASAAPAADDQPQGETKFSAEVLGKLLHSIGEINATMKALGVQGGLGALYGMAKSDTGGAIVVKALEGMGVVEKSAPADDLQAEFASMRKRLIALESAGDSKALPGSGGSPVTKNDDGNLFKGVV